MYHLFGYAVPLAAFVPAAAFAGMFVGIVLVGKRPPAKGRV